MEINFQNALPAPLAEFQHLKNSVWKNDFQINFPHKVLLNASSGKGKSTFINILYGIRKDFSGDVLLDGKSINTFSLDQWVEIRKDRISVIFQDLQLFPELTVWENLKLKNDLTNHHDEKRIREMLGLLGIAEKENQSCKTLSLGQQQRVAIIRALLQPFELLLMDEPFSHLDEHNTEIALKLINEETDINNAGFILTTLGSDHGFAFDQELIL